MSCLAANAKNFKNNEWIIVSESTVHIKHISLNTMHNTHSTYNSGQKTFCTCELIKLKNPLNVSNYERNAHPLPV